MNRIISHDRKLETIEAKTLWFRSLSMSERMETFCEFMDLIWSINPNLKGRANAKPASGRIQVISKE